MATRAPKAKKEVEDAAPEVSISTVTSFEKEQDLDRLLEAGATIDTALKVKINGKSYTKYTSTEGVTFLR